MDKKEYLVQLRLHPLFQFVDDEELDALAEHCTLLKLTKGQLVSPSEQPLNHLCLILDGIAKVVLKDELDNIKTLNFIDGQNSFFGYVSILSGRSDTDVFAYTDLTLLCISGEQILQLAGVNPKFSLALLREIAERLNDTRRQLNYIAHKNLEARVAIQLLRLAHQFGEQRDGGVFIDLPITHQELSELVGTNRETTTRILNDFKKEGLIENRSKHIVIVDKYKLEQSWAKK